MATENQGIMSLPQGGEKEAPQMPQMGLDESYDAVKGGLQDVSPQASAAMQQTLAQITPQLDQLSDEQLDAFIQLFQFLQEHPEEYKKHVQELISNGVFEEGTLPDEYDPEILSTLAIVFLEAKKQRQMGNEREAAMSMPQPPATMARGGIAEAARMVAAQGRTGDTMLAHINKKEAAMLKKHGGIGTINPATGLPEYGWNPIKTVTNFVSGAVSSVVGAVKSVINTVKSVVQSPIGKILGTIALATILGPGAMGFAGMNLGAAALPLASGAITALSGGNLKDVLRSAATAYLGSPGGPVESFIGNAGAAMGVTNAAGQAAINAGITGAGVGLLTGQSLKDSVKSGLIAGAIQGGTVGAQKGFDAQVMTPDKVVQNITSGGGQAPTDYKSMADAESARLAGNYPPGSSNNLAIGAETAPPAGQQAAGQGGGGGGGTPPPTGPTGLSRIGGGIADMAQGNFGTGFENVKGGLGDLYDKISPSAIQKEGMANAQQLADKAYTDAIAQNKPEALAMKAYDAAIKANTPGVFSTYGPMLGVGLAATGALGGFQPNNPPQSEMLNTMKGTPGEDLIKANPSKYITQNLPGVEYDSTGNIIGSKPWSPSATMADVRVPANSMGMGMGIQPPMGSMYTPGLNTLGQRPQVYQPYNTASMYSNLMPRYADGGMIDQPVEHRWYGGIMDAVRRILPAPAPAPTMADVQAAPANYAPMAAAPAGMGGRMTPEMRAAFAQRFAQGLQFNPRAAAQQARSAQPYNTSAPYGNLVSSPGMPPSNEIRIPEYGMPWATQPVTPPSNEIRIPEYGMPELRGGTNVPAPARFRAFQASPAQLRAQAYFNPAQAGLMAAGGLASLAQGGYPRRTGQISGPGTEKSDSIPAMLSDGEFVMTAKAVRGAGNGSRRAGAKKMYALMHQLERNASRG